MWRQGKGKERKDNARELNGRKVKITEHKEKAGE